MDLFKTPAWRALEWAESHGLFYVAGALIIAVVLGVGVKRTQKVRREWQAFALRHGLEYEAPGTFWEFVKGPESPESGTKDWPYGRVHGTLGAGIAFELRVSGPPESAGIGKTRPRYAFSSDAAIRVRFAGIPEGLNVSRKLGELPRIVDRLRSMSGFHAVETGDPIFDEKFSVMSANPETAKAYLNRPRRDALIRLAEREGWALNVHGLFLSASALADPAELDRAFGDLAEAARALAGDRSP